jgi:hypothetical protein
MHSRGRLQLKTQPKFKKNVQGFGENVREDGIEIDVSVLEMCLCACNKTAVRLSKLSEKGGKMTIGRRKGS